MSKLKSGGIALMISLGVVGVCLYVASVVDQPPLLDWEDPWNKRRATAVGQEYMVVAGTPWATEAAVKVLEQGGNAFDAAVAALLVINVTFGEAASFPSIAPLLIYDAEAKQARSYVGVGTAPAAATIEKYKARGFDSVPKMDIYSQLLPASPDVIVELLSEYGTQSFTQVSAEAIRIAEEGFPIHKIMLRNLDFNLVERLGFNWLLPYNAEVYIDNRWWRPLQHKQLFKRPHLAATLSQLANAETEILQKGGSSLEGLQAVRDYFYKGPLAEKILTLHEQESGLFTREDLANYKGKWEEPLSGTFKNFTIKTNGTWTQGIVVPMVLQMLETINLKAMGHNSVEYVHTVAQVIEIVMADREAFIGDADFVKVPVKQLLSHEYAEARAAILSNDAFTAIPVAGDPYHLAAIGGKVRLNNYLASLNNKTIGKDTSYLSIIDQQGNAVSMTPSDFPNSPMVPETGMTLGIRMTQFRLDPEHPSSLEPGKRPRVTPHALMVFNPDNSLYMSLGTPGADMQTQALIQVLLNHFIFGMEIQEAIEQPRFRSLNLPDSFSPHSYSPATLHLEKSLYQQVANGLVSKGYALKEFDDLHNHFSAVGAVVKNNGKLYGGADPREETMAKGR